MSPQRYSVTPQPIDTLLAWVRSGEIAIPEIQRPFVWDATQVRNLLDSLYRGFPVGYLIAWRNPNVRLKDGTLSAGKRILIDGQQRVTALMAGLLGRQVLTKDYEAVRIRIAFHPLNEKFEVFNSAIENDCSWISDVSTIFESGGSIYGLVDAYATANPGTSKDDLFRRIERLRGIVNNQMGIIELAPDLDIETVTEIFIRVNSAGVSLSQADFAMSKIAANESYGGNTLRKAIEYFCHMSVKPDFHDIIRERDTAFADTDYFQKMRWLRNVQDDIYDPSYTDMLRVAFTSEFGRGKLQDLVALLSGRNFETKQYEDAIAEDSFARLRQGVLRFINETSFKQLVMILRSAGFVSSDLIGGRNAVNFAYILYLRGKAAGMNPAAIERMVRRWYVMSVLTGRYAGNPETSFDFDIRQIEARGPEVYVESVIEGELSDGFWRTLLPQNMETSSASSPYFLVYQAAQVKMGDKGFLSRDMTVQDLILHKSDAHHLFPRNLLKKQGLSRGRYNQIANFVVAQSEINIRISDKAPSVYFAELLSQCDSGKPHYGGIIELDVLKENLRMHCIPEAIFGALSDDYDGFLAARRSLMADKIKAYFAML
ncbi:DUF262 domain-containing protein [Azospirillum sp. A29]|uniref:GmrSD restriction endonuclease domain-containing protein n=1 Tax=Azospirillum sp. A29 TaxID=3160606 RepID=UPI00366EE434